MDLSRRGFLYSAGAALAGCAGSRNVVARRTTVTTKPAARSIFRPPPGQVLFIAGQDGPQLGGRPEAGQGDGYLDHMPIRPAGVTLYCSVSAPPDVEYLKSVCDLPALKDSLLHLSVCWVDDFNPATVVNNRAITEGALDANIELLARWCAAQPRPILMRIGYEFDRGLPVRDFHYDRACFAAGFRRIVDRLRTAEARNVATVLASTNAPGLSPVLTPEAFAQYYPGDDYVDWLGCSMWRPEDVDAVILAEARRRGKPVLLAETTPVKYNVAEGGYYPYYYGRPQKIGARGIWDRWHGPMIEFIRANADVIGAWHYIAADWSADAMWKDMFFFAHCDARPWADPEFLKLWDAGVNSGMFLHGSAGLFRELGYSSARVRANLPG